MKLNKRRVLVLGLNEFNRELLGEAAEKFDLKNFQKLFRLNETRTRTDDTYESNFLEPWVQWVSLQTGRPSSEHQIKHLGDIPNSEFTQLWEELSKRNVTSGIWGAMNASRGSAKNCLFFLPDPWTFSEDGYPSELSRLLKLPRYLAKNYLHISKKEVVRRLASLVRVFAASKTKMRLITEIPRLAKNVVKFKGEHFVFITFLDYILTALFIEYRHRFDPQFSLIFLNGIAHMQHHHWSGRLEDNLKLKTGMSYLDRSVGLLFEDMKSDDIFLCANALSQKNTNADAPWILYRQKDQMKFLRSMGIAVSRVEPHMTHDAHIFFEDESKCIDAFKLLERATIQNRRLFTVETYSDDPKKLFYRIDFTDPIALGSFFEFDGKSLNFYDHFQEIVTRTGKHIGEGTVFSNMADIPKHLYNHELFHTILGVFDEIPQRRKKTINQKNESVLP